MKKCIARSCMANLATIPSYHTSVGDVKKPLSILKYLILYRFHPTVMKFKSIISVYRRIGKVTFYMEMIEKFWSFYGKPNKNIYTTAIVDPVGDGKNEINLELASEIIRAGYFMPTVLNWILNKVWEMGRSGEEFQIVLSEMEALKFRLQRAPRVTHW